MTLPVLDFDGSWAAINGTVPLNAWRQGQTVYLVLRTRHQLGQKVTLSREPLIVGGLGVLLVRDQEITPMARVPRSCKMPNVKFV